MINFQAIEKKWQKRWEEEGIGFVDRDENKKKFFIIWAYTTVSGFQHTGHMRGYSYADAISRFKRMTGHNVLLCGGAHATGNGAITKAMQIKNKSEKWIKDLKDRGLDNPKIKELGTVEGFIDFFSKEYVKDYKRFGFIGDWRRFMVTTSTGYEKFIEWQFRKLKKLGYIIQKPYYANCCIRDGPVAVDPSEMDLSKGGNAEQQEYTIIKLQYGNQPDQYIVVATLRPETMYGQTNVWIDYNCDYVKFNIKPNNGKKEVWIASKNFADKIKYQMDGVKIIGKISGKELSGNYCKAPYIKKDIIILPCNFADPTIGTGIITSVPSDAPIDYIGLKDLHESKELCEKYNLDYEKIKGIELIPIIKTKGFGKFPAKEICEKYNITSQNDSEKLEKAKKEVYKKGFHTGQMGNNAKEFSGMKVNEAKDLMKKKLIDLGKADIFYDLSEEVICRCGNPVYVMKRENAWFIKYSDEAWTDKAKNYSKKMNFYPEFLKQTFNQALEWFSDRACAREGKWLGTTFPFDDNYIIEAISDSTLYPIYYLISYYVNKKEITPEQLVEEFFDYVFLGKGDLDKISDKTRIDKKLIEKIKKDVDYWYPLDINLGGKEHMTVHFPPFLMNHIAILPKEKWPKGIFINYWVMQEKDQKLSKSKGGAQPIPGISEKYSIDGMRLYYANATNPFADIYFDEKKLLTYKEKIENLYEYLNEILTLDLNKKEHKLDKWVISKFNSALENATIAMEEFEFKTTSNIIYLNMPKFFRIYINKGGRNSDLISEYLGKWIRMTGLFTPHLAEELNELFRKKFNLEQKMVSVSSWPKIQKEKINKKIEYSLDFVEKIKKDIRDILELINLDKPKEIKLIISPKWKYKFYKILKNEIKKTRKAKELIPKFMINDLKKYGKDIIKLISNCLNDESKIPQVILDQEEEIKLVKSFSDELKEEFESEISIDSAEECNDPKSKNAKPSKPAILIK